MRVVLHELKKAMKETHVNKKASQSSFACSNSLASLMERLPDNGLELLVCLLKEHYRDFYDSAIEERLLPIKASTFVFVPSVAALDLDTITFGELEINYSEKGTQLQCNVASESFGLAKNWIEL